MKKDRAMETLAAEEQQRESQENDVQSMAVLAGQNNQPQKAGLRLSGTVISRRRRVISAKKPGDNERYVIVLRVEGGGMSATAETWSDVKLPVGLPQLGDDVSLAVEVRSYVQGGLARHTLVFGGGEKGEAF
jgi:hypothetical protein